MNKIVSFLMVGLFFALFNVATVAADPAGLVSGDDNHNTGEDCAALGTADAVAACNDRKTKHGESNHGGMATGTTGMSGDVPSTTAGDGGVALTIDDPRCAAGLAPGTRASECPNYRP